MQFKMFSIRDTKAEIYHPPFFKGTHGEAERAFQELVTDQKSQISKYPEDFDLFYVGQYDDETGKLHPEITPQHVVKAINLTKPTGLNAV